MTFCPAQRSHEGATFACLALVIKRGILHFDPLLVRMHGAANSRARFLIDSMLPKRA
jgi:hypothetical protein